MRAFLSHSSKDKGFLEGVTGTLRPGTYELDSLTFDAGLVNSNAIIESLKRCDLFCLFLSVDSVSSPYVDFETLLGIEFFAKSSISRIVVICLDDEAFSLANENIKFFNIVRKVSTPESAARLIQGHLISCISDSDRRNHPFVGREDEMAELEGQISDLSRPLIRALFISGNAGSGRRTLARKFYEDQFPHVGKIFPQVDIESFDGLEELYRAVIMKLRPSISTSDLLTRARSFSIANIGEKRRIIAQLFNSLLPAKEAAYLVDVGGVLNDAGGFFPEISDIISQLDARPHPPVIFISTRMVPKRLRRSENDIAYAPVRVLKWDKANRLIGRLLKDRSIQATSDNVDDLTKLSDCHPYNIYRIVDDIAEYGIDYFLNNPRDFIEWKHRNSSEYFNKIDIDDNERFILGVLKIIPQLDFDSIVSSTGLDSEIVSDALRRLDYLHIIDAHDNRFLISPALRTAVERDRRMRLSKGEQQSATKSIASSLTVRIEKGLAPSSLLNAAIISSIESGEMQSELISAFMLPSHHVWLCKHHYDQRQWGDSIRHGREALQGIGRLSLNGIVAACRYICLAASRLSEERIFNEAISVLEKSAVDDWSKSNVSYLKGFNLRNKGRFPAAEEFFRAAIILSPGNHSALRELAAIALARGNLIDAEVLAREALSHATSNPYLLDILLAVLIRKHGRDAARVSEIDDLFTALEAVGEEGGRSFFTTRKAEFEHLCGNNKKALNLIGLAIKKTPGLFEPHRLRAEILLKDGNKSQAADEIRIMKQMIESGGDFDRKFNSRSYTETYSNYLMELGDFGNAKKLFNDNEIFTDDERREFIKNIEVVEGYNKLRGR